MLQFKLLQKKNVLFVLYRFVTYPETLLYLMYFMKEINKEKLQRGRK